MINNIINLLKKIFLNARGTTYGVVFEDAKKFTTEQGFPLDSYTKSDCEASIHELIEELSGKLYAYTLEYHRHDFDPIIKLGGDCANIHHQILLFIKEHYPLISANLTIGETFLSNRPGFQFDQDKCVEWLINGSPQLFDCHAWITINNEYILDCTIGTYINTRIDPNKDRNNSEKLFGGLIFGTVDNLQHIAFSNLKGKTPHEYHKIKYTPVILGMKALYALAPKHT